MKLLTQELRQQLPQLRAQEHKGGDAIVHLKFFTPDSNWTWHIIEGSPVLDEDGNEVDYVDLPPFLGPVAMLVMLRYSWVAEDEA